MRKLWLDLETYSETPIKHGAHRYAEKAEVLLFSYAVDDEEVEVWDRTVSTVMPAAVAEGLYNPAVEIWAQNSGFDRTVLRHAMRIDKPLSRWRDTMIQAFSHGLPGNLGQLCDIFNLSEEDAKQKDGKRLIQLFCKPLPKNQKLRRATRDTHPEEWQRFINYAGGDIRAMRELHKRIPLWNYREADILLWHRDQRANDRGVCIDVDLAREALATTEREKRVLARHASDLTDGALEATTQRAALKKLLEEEYGVSLPDMTASTIERRLNDPELPEVVKDLLRNRQDATLSSLAKYGTLLNAVSSDGRIRGTLQFRGASRTGRWAGRIFQPQNLPRPKHKQHEVDEAIPAIKSGVADLLYPDVMQRMSSCIRGAIMAPEGRKLVVADLANIEGRVLAWLAGEEWKLQAFRDYDTIIGWEVNKKGKKEAVRKGPDLYVAAYAKSFNVTIEEILHNKDYGDGLMRMIGKVQELALGYQGAVGAFGSMAAVYGVELPQVQVLKIVKGWRKAHPHVVSFWYELEETCINAIINPKQTYLCRKLSVRMDGAWLKIKLPSGRLLCYPGARLVNGKIVYKGVDQYTRRWQDIRTYGGKLVENVTQAVAADLIGLGFAAADDAGYEPLLTVHDEVITETPDTEEFTVSALADMMTIVPDWARGLPLAAEGFEAKRYRK